MPPRKKVDAVIEEVVEEQDLVPEIFEEIPDVVVAVSNTKTAKVKGTWTMYWGNDMYEFEDGKRYKLPLDLYGYLVNHGNIYDTL